MIELADYYRCLPILSNSTVRALLNSPEVSDEIRGDEHRAFAFAAKLRNANLFRGVLINVANPWNRPYYLELSDSKLKKAAQW
jgi:hypothetical protein